MKSRSTYQRADLFRPAVFLLALFGLVLSLLVSCQAPHVDKVYALHLEQPPVQHDWQRALPRLVTVRGGRPNETRPFADIDEDTVHTSTASCHHGAKLPDPVEVDIRAFYTDTDLFLRLAWRDASRDDAMSEWTFDGSGWQSNRQQEDGFGLMWDARGSFSGFTCAHACHISDFGVSGANFHARNRMQLARSDVSVDLWNWKASRTGRHGFVDDRFVDDKGMHGDVPGELFRANSRNAVSGQVAPDQVFAEGDVPLFDGEGTPLGDSFRPAGSTVPGFLTETPIGSRADIRAVADHENSGWVVILKRRLDTGDPKDVVFFPGDESGVAFGLSIMDNTLSQHYASAGEERLVLMAKNRAGDE